LYRYTGAVNLCEAVDILINALEDTIETETEPPILAVFDTWSRSLGGDDSVTSDAAEGLHKLDLIREKFPGLAIMIIHHTGHKEKERARGAYLLHAAVDSEFRIKKETNGNIIFTNTKSKESKLLPSIAFKAREVMLLSDDERLLRNDDKEIMASVILDAIDFTPPITGGTFLGKNQKLILEALCNAEGQSMKQEDLLETLKNHRFKMKKDAFDKVIQGLKDRELVHDEAGSLCIGEPKARF
jgi:hypothetical protein